ncbi:MAG: tRNA lysidine(34) synthetase TilS [Bdellovibrionaceae bacterium]|nr:tRNA lysidine(34) synthetase TilS [Bdellovibrionales bacterium]MCB9083923.1 tRNA lysidine(34) synthetase TilS [Pseudobdellovibrionaceae bacterium]
MATVLLKKKTSLNAFEHQVIRQLRPLELNGAVLLLAVSGGRDSMTLLHLMTRVSAVLKVELAVAHVHHGPAGGKKGRFRRQAWELVARESQRLGLRLYSNVCPHNWHSKSWRMKWLVSPRSPLKSEDELRDFRHGLLETWRSELQAQKGQRTFTLTAHHQDDLLETRMIRLIRGSGLKGLRAMGLCDGILLRPLIGLSRQQVSEYGKSCSLTWVEDPSNQQVDPLRNWLRHEWLPALEKRRRSAVATLARSLELIANEGEDDLGESEMGVRVLDRRKYLEMTREQKKRTIASYLRRLGVKGYGQSHVEEIIKRLDSSRRELRFTVLKWDWFVNAEQIRAFRPEGEPGIN